MSTRFRVDGLKELDKALAQLKFKDAKGVLRRTALKTLEPVRDTAIELAPDDPETPPAQSIRGNIIVSTQQKSSRFSAKGDTETFAQAFVGPTGAAYPQAMTAEMGSKPHKIRARKKGGEVGFEVAGQSVVVPEVDHPGHAPMPYMRPAWEQHKDQLLPRLAETLWADIQKTARRVAKRDAKKAGRG